MRPDSVLRLIGEAVFEATHQAIGARGRAIHSFHEPEDAVQRMVHAMSPQTYIQPHRHIGSGRAEVCIALMGAATVLCFDEDGTLNDRQIIQSGSSLVGVEVPPGIFHTLIALKPQTTLFEIHQGPYCPGTHKQPAPWAPPEGTEAGVAWMEALR